MALACAMAPFLGAGVFLVVHLFLSWRLRCRITDFRQGVACKERRGAFAARPTAAVRPQLLHPRARWRCRAPVRCALLRVGTGAVLPGLEPAGLACPPPRGPPGPP